MSREDPQFKLRMPTELKAKADQAAKNSGRSLNAELIARLEATFLLEASPGELLPAKKAKELAEMARNGIPKEIKRRAIEAISQAIKHGQKRAYASMTGLALEVGIEDEELDKILDESTEDLKKAGYKVNFEDIGTLVIDF